MYRAGCGIRLYRFLIFCKIYFTEIDKGLDWAALEFLCQPNIFVCVCISILNSDKIPCMFTVEAMVTPVISCMHVDGVFRCTSTEDERQCTFLRFASLCIRSKIVLFPVSRPTIWNWGRLQVFMAISWKSKEKQTFQWQVHENRMKSNSYPSDVIFWLISISSHVGSILIVLPQRMIQLPYKNKIKKELLRPTDHLPKWGWNLKYD